MNWADVMKLLTRIGGGGMALVYKAHDILLNRNVAVKVLRQQFVHDEEFIRRFRREAQSAASLSHPNVVSIYDVGQEDEIHYIVMEYVEGHNLNEIIKEQAPLQIEEAVRYCQSNLRCAWIMPIIIKLFIVILSRIIY